MADIAQRPRPRLGGDTAGHAREIVGNAINREDGLDRPFGPDRSAVPARVVREHLRIRREQAQPRLIGSRRHAVGMAEEQRRPVPRAIDAIYRQQGAIRHRDFDDGIGRGKRAEGGSHDPRPAAQLYWRR